MLLVAGCATERLTVAASDWQTVPAPQRSKLDHQSQAELDAARAEARLAARTLAELEQAPAEAPLGGKLAGAPAAGGNAAWAAEQAQPDRARGAALSRIDRAALAKRRTELAWRQRWVVAATDRIDVVTAERELQRAQAVDRNLLGDDTYETAPLRGQFSQAQVRWYTAAGDADQARGAFERATRELTSAKEAYAELMKAGPGNAMADATAAAEPPRDPFQLPSWSLTRFDIRRKSGMRHFIDQTVSTSQIHTPRLHISRALLSVPATTTASAEPPAPAGGSK